MDYTINDNTLNTFLRKLQHRMQLQLPGNKVKVLPELHHLVTNPATQQMLVTFAGEPLKAVTYTPDQFGEYGTRFFTGAYVGANPVSWINTLIRLTDDGNFEAVPALVMLRVHQYGTRTEQEAFANTVKHIIALVGSIPNASLTIALMVMSHYAFLFTDDPLCGYLWHIGRLYVLEVGERVV